MAHSTLQCRHFITTRAGGTNYGMYRQALRELSSRTNNLKEEYLVIAEAEVEREEAEFDLAEHVEAYGPVADVADVREGFARRRLVIRVARANAALHSLGHTVKWHECEWREFYGQAMLLRARLGLLPGQALDRERRAALDLHMWERQLENGIAARMLAHEHAIDSNLLELLRSMPEQSARRLMQAVDAPVEFLDRVKARQRVEAPNVDLDTLDAVEPRRLIECP
ncbi:MAG: hypothetical protein GY716_15755 [bacterium]|nr:hypothetical protein [bacterium]